MKANEVNCFHMQDDRSFQTHGVMMMDNCAIHRLR